MGIKVLINCRNPQRMQSIFANISSSFDCMSTSEFTEDIVRHVKYYKPDVFLTIFETLDYNTIQQYYHIRKKEELNGVPFAMIASPELCEQVKKSAPDLFDWIFNEPKAPQDLRIILSETVARAAELKHEPIVLIGDDEIDPADRKKILVVDDDKTTLRLLKTALEEKQYTVTAMANGKIAEKFLQTKTADLILLDYQMPQESGADVLKNIRADSRLADIPVIFLTGVSDSNLVQDVISMKPQGYLLKPINMERLFIMIRNLIG